MACLPSLSQFLIQATSFFHKFIIVIMLCQGTGQLERLADIDPSDDSCNANLESTGHVPGFLKPEVRPHPSYFVYQMFLGRARTKIAQTVRLDVGKKALGRCCVATQRTS